MAESFLGQMKKVIESLHSFMQDSFKRQTDMKKGLQSLTEIYPKIQAVVSYAKPALIEHHNAALNMWIWQLRDAIDEVDDILDDYYYMKFEESIILRNRMEDGKLGKRTPKIDLDLKRLKEAVRKLYIVSADVSVFLHILDSINQEQREQLVELHSTRETGSLPSNDLIGRGKDMKYVIDWLRKPSNDEDKTHVRSTTLYNNISVLSIVGHVGMGKTTLLQHVYHDEITKGFDLKMWVCVSYNFDVKTVIADMLESLQNKRTSLDTLDELLKSLQSEVISKKFLLVLDDVWDEDEAVLFCKWSDIFAPLSYGGLGSKILISTRTDSASSMIEKVIRKKEKRLRLEGLKEDECLQLLTTHAFVGKENLDDHVNLRSIAEEFVKKLYGSPLAAKVIGGILNCNFNERHWRSVLDNNLGFEGIFPILKLSYIFLPEYLKSCFSFCSIFEQDHVFVKDDLVRMWIAVGLIQPYRDNQEETLTLEDIGGRYFDILIKRCFFVKVSITGYKLHDLLHELAQSVFKQECFRFVGDTMSQLLEIPKTIRHLSFQTDNLELLKEMGRFENLRSLIITYNGRNFVNALDEMFKVTRSIRLLHINCRLEEIPENIEYLRHLRYLRILFFNGKLLPRSLSRLYHLQFIIFEGQHRNYFSNNDYFPRDMYNLSNLRYLSSMLLSIPGIGKLKLLQQLKEFYIKNENGYRIDELEHMNELCSLGIANLKDVGDAQEAFNAKLCDKRKLTDLFLEWNHAESENDHDLDEKVLDNLQPHNHLKTLKLTYYMGARSAKWMEALLIKNLEEVRLFSCLEWEILPQFGQLPFLKTLWLWNMPKATQFENKVHGNDMCCDFPSLEELQIVNLKALVHWFHETVDRLFPCLTKLFLSDCPNLQELPYLPPKLESLRIVNIGWRTLNCCSFSNSIPLQRLSVLHCQNITSFSLAAEIRKPINLKEVAITGSSNLISVREYQEVEASISSLEILELDGLPELREYPDLFHPKKLIIKNCNPELMKRHKQFSSSN